MSDVFISYKSEDGVRVARLVRALEREGLSVWWDRPLSPGLNWLDEIREQLEKAKCVVVVWTNESTGPTGDFVRDEARWAKSRGLLIPVKLDHVGPPLGFGEIQAIDLTRWKGSSSDPFFQDLCGAVRARISGGPNPPAKGRVSVFMRQLRYGSVASAVIFSSAAVGLNLYGVQNRICTMSVLQPHLSDACGALGLGDRPTVDERLAWEHRQPGSCEDLKTHLERFPEGHYRSVAEGLLDARRVVTLEAWPPTTRRLELYVPSTHQAEKDEATAQAGALEDGAREAARLCGNFAAGTIFRFVSAAPSVRAWDCARRGIGITCAFTGEAVCELLERQVEHRETCGS